MAIHSWALKEDVWETFFNSEVNIFYPLLLLLTSKMEMSWCFKVFFASLPCSICSSIFGCWLIVKQISVLYPFFFLLWESLISIEVYMKADNAHFIYES